MPIFMRIDGIDGDVTAAGFEKWLGIQAYNWSENVNVRNIGSGAASGKVVFQDLHCQKQYDKASPQLFLKCANGKHIAKVNLVHAKTQGDKFDKVLEIKLEDVIISSYEVAGHDGSLPFDGFGLSFAKMTLIHYTTNVDGSVEPTSATWDIKSNTGG